MSRILGKIRLFVIYKSYNSKKKTLKLSIKNKTFITLKKN